MANITCEELMLQRCKECYVPFPLGNSPYQDSKLIIDCPKRILEEQKHKENPDYRRTHEYKEGDIILLNENRQFDI